MRSKEDAHDYRYFPDPDLLPIVVNQDRIEAVRRTLPELPWTRRDRYAAEFGLAIDDARTLAADRPLAEYFEAVVKASGDARQSANWLNGELAANLNRQGLGIEACPITPERLGALIRRIIDGTLSGNLAKQLFEGLWNLEGEVDELIDQKGLRQLNDSDVVRALIAQVMDESPAQVAQYRSGKDKVFGYFVGQVMRRSQGKANPQQLNDLLREMLS
jgi:aspartyl-tRNA(Asn)/glutamyl-tRNA(Gln) amidotransferase subunit B